MRQDREVLGSEVLAWIEKALPSAVAEPELVADTKRSLVARLRTADTVAYFKADRILPPAEAVILARLALHRPEWVAPLLAVDEQRGWTLTGDAGATGLDGSGTDTWCRVVRRFGELQLDTGLDADGWAALGCRDLRGNGLRQAIESMLEDTEAHLEPSTREGLLQLRPRIDETCRLLAADGVPATLVHQDFVPVNIIVRDGEPVFLDWSDTVVGHPFFGCDRLLDSCWKDPERKAAVIDAYLEPFTALLPATQLRGSFQQVLWLRVLYECVRWHHEIAAVGAAGEHAELLRRDTIQGLSLMVKHQR